MSKDVGAVASHDATGADDVRATLDAWRARGADRVDLVRFHFIEAMERRAAMHGGEARRVLDARLTDLLAAYGENLAKAGFDAVASVETPSPCTVSRGALGELLDHIAGRTSAASASAQAQSQPQSSQWSELEVLEYFREVWSRLSTERQLRQSQQQVPGNAGPLNSSSLVHRSLSLMRELSPGYLQHFLSYVDALSWMEQLNAGGVLPGKEAPRATATKKSTRAGGTSR